jgi:hypothetical protein
MKTKNIWTFLIVLSTLAFNGCNEEEFLNVQPKGALSGDQLQTPEGVNALVTSAYAGLSLNAPDPGSAFFQPASNWSFGDVRSDDAYKGGGGVGDISEYHDLEIGNIRADNFTLQRKWNSLYIAIGRCNRALAALNDATLEEVPEKETHIGEMRLLRGHFYFDLLKNFGSFAYIDETIKGEAIEEVSNSFDKDELWGYIEDDFGAAIEKLPETSSHLGRVNVFAAHAYLCKAYMFQEKWDDAITEADAVINSGQYSLFSDFTQLWDVESEHGSEMIFSIEHSIDDGSEYGNINWGNLLNAPRGPAYNGDGFHRPSQNLVNAYRVDENGLPLFDSFNEQDVIPSDPIDPRLDHTIGRLGIPWKSFDKPYDESWLRNIQEYGPYSPKKYLVDPNSPYMISGWPWGASALNWALIKYSDVMLWKAEALIESGSDLEEARNLINKIRERAKNSTYVQKLDGSGPAANYNIGLYPAANWTQAYARKALRTERRLELALEGHRFYDLARWEVAAEVLNSYFSGEASKRSYYSNANFVKNKHEYLPIPQDEIDRSGGVYSQSPLY